MRRKSCHVGLLGIFGGLSSAWLGAATIPDSAVALSPPFRVEARLTPGREDVYTVDLAPGDYLLTIDQGGLDLIVSASSTQDIVVNSPSFRDDRETVLLGVARSATHTITIRCDEYTGAEAFYSISIDQLNDFTDIAGYRLMTEAAAANYQRGTENWQRALSAYKVALELWQQSENLREQARTLYYIGYLQYWQFYSWAEAAQSAAAAADLYDASDQPGLATNARHLQAASLIEAANEVGSSQSSIEDDAETIFGTALALFEAAADDQAALDLRYARAHTINNIGLTHFYRDDLASARQYFAQAAQEFRHLDEWSSEMISLANIAVIDHEKGRLGSAVATYERLLELLPVDREATWRADTLDNLATTQLLLGETDAAMQSFFAALKLHEQQDNPKGQGRSVAGIGSTYLAIGELERAREYLERSLVLRRAANDGKGQVADLRNLANIHRMLGQLEASLEYHEQALELATSPLVRARVLVQQARDWIDTADMDKAISALAVARNTADEEGATRVSADAAYESGRAFVLIGDTTQGEHWLHKAHDLYAGIGVRSGQAQSLLALARLASADNLESAIAYSLEAVDLVEDLRSNVADLELRAVYLGRRGDYYEFLIDVLMRASSSSTTDSAAQDYVRRALEVSERARARATVDLINEAAIDLAQSIDPKILERQLVLDKQLVERTFLRDRLLERNASPEAIKSAVAELQAVRTELDVLEAEARRSSSRYAELKEPEVLDASAIQELLGEDTVVLQYALGDASSFLWIITRDSIRSVKIPDRATVSNLARKVYEGLSSPSSQAPAKRQGRANIDDLSAMIVTPAADELGRNSRVVIAADGALQYLPFSVLAPDGATILNETHDLVVIPSLTVVAAQREVLEEQVAPTKTLAVIGDPVFEAFDPRLHLQASSTVSPPRGSTSDSAARSLSRLPFSGYEVEQIAALVDENERFVATGLSATRESIAGDRLKEYRYVHFATHGIIDGSQPALSTLALSMRNADGGDVDGFFRLRDIYSMQLNADLVVLSACDTALGREIRGEGLIGMTQGFLYAGAGQVVASLWQVPDRATAELMTLFYKRLLDGKQSPVAALRGAQRDMAKQRRWRDPYYWSGFVAQGDWR